MPDDFKQTLTPKLRFPEFQGEWETSTLGRLAKRVTTKNDTGTVTRVLTNSAEYGILDQKDFFNRDIATPGKVDGYFVSAP